MPDENDVTSEPETPDAELPTPVEETPEVAPEETPEVEEVPASEEVPEVAPEETPAPEEVPEAPEVAPALEPKSGGVSWVPFSVYLLAWVILAVGTVVVLRDAALAGGALWAEEYVYTVYGGIGLAATGPVLAIIVWLFTRTRRSPEDRKGLFVSSLLLGAGMTFLGTILWLVSLYVLDLYRTGVLS
ncbi:MAG: hypothetical protein ACYC77_09975 [Coriobacteriia bacterium]